MYFRHLLWFSSALLILLACSGTGTVCLGQQASYRDSTHWNIELPVWIPGFRGGISFGDVTIDTDGDGGSKPGLIDHLFDSKLGLDYYLVGKVRYTRERWQFQADIFGGQIKNSTIFNYNGMELSNTKIKLIIPRFTVSYQVFEFPLKKEGAGMVRGYLYSGLKVFHADVQATLPEPINPLDLRSSWTEFLLGGSVSYFLRDWTFTFRTEMAPFKLFIDSSWWYQCYARYRFGKKFSAQMGWVRQDFSSLHKVLDKDLKLHFTLQGPLAGIAFHF